MSKPIDMSKYPGFTRYDGTPETTPVKGALCAIAGWDYVGIYSPARHPSGPVWFNEMYGKFVPFTVGDIWAYIPVNPEDEVEGR